MGLSKSSPANPQVKLLVSSTRPHIPWSLLSWLALGSGAALLVAVIFSGARLIVDPYSPNWLKNAFPGLVTSFEAQPQTAEEVDAELRSQNITASQPIAWPSVSQPKAWIYPILDDRSIQELWVYRVRGTQRQRVEQVSIRPMKESFITTPLVGTASQVASVDSDAHLTTVKLMPGKASDGPWLLLEGQRRYGNTVMRYGQILSYQSRSQRLHRLLNWSSSAGQPPQWQSGETDDQLVINQTVGLRPSFLLYQLIPNEPPQLKEVSLYRSVYTSELSTSLYDKALKLAQGGVWSHSLQMMESAKKALAENWSPQAQTQLDLIRLHAVRTQAQIEQTWSSQQQHILAYLIDGQWEKALRLLEDNPAIYEATLKRLALDFDALWRAVTVHLQVHPKDATTQIWGALLVAARQSPEAGEKWLQQKTRSKSTLTRLQAVGKQPEIAAVMPAAPTEAKADTISAAPLPTSNHSGRYLGMVGQAKAISTPTGEWLRSQTLPTLVPGQTWYQINVQLLQDGSGWGLPPGSITAANFWAESLGMRQQMQLFSNRRPVANITVHGVRSTGAGLALLAIGPDMEGGTTFAATNNSLQWLNTLPWQVAPAPPTDISDPALVASPTESTTQLATAIGNQLGISSEQTAQLYAHLQYTSLDLRGDAAPEHIFLVSDGVPSEFGLTPGRTMIFSNHGELIYSDVGQQSALVALTSRSPEQPATLLIEQSGRYDVIGL